MIVLDSNILLYRQHKHAHQHERVKQWLERLIETSEYICLPWVSIWAFLRISTNRRVHAEALTIQESADAVRTWLALPQSRPIDPGPRHVEILSRLMEDGQITGTRVTDAVLAALAIEHGATLASTDRDFARFEGLRWVNPLTAAC